MNRTRKHPLYKLKTSRKNLKYSCPNTIQCFAFGIEIDSIKFYFNNFDNFKLIKSPVIKMGNYSENGFIQKIHYQKKKYSAYAILKSALKTISDNLYYEYLVGQKINLYNKYVPSFIQTYGIYEYQNKFTWEVSKNSRSLDKNQIEGLFSNLKNISDVPEKELLLEACNNSKYIAIMLQYIEHTRSFRNYMMDDFFNRYFILPVIFQVYTTLYTLRKFFTHYDLHYENIVLYEPKPNTYIQYHYNIDGKVIKFKSPFMVKILDYGRSYFSINIRDDLCKLCNDCGIYDGFELLYSQKNDPYSSYVTPRFLNNSADLRFLYDIKRKVRATPHLKKMFNIKFANEYGTPEDLSYHPGEIRNIKDAFDTICKIMVLPDVLADNEAGVLGMTKFGDLEIFTDMSKEMRFTKARN